METALNPTRLVGLGSMFGAILETSGGAQSIAVTMVKKFGDEKAVWALGITGLVIAMPVFCAVRLLAMIVAGPVFGAFCGKKYNIAIPEHVANQADFDESKLPSFGTIVGIIMIPLVLIILDSLAGEVSDWHG